MASNGPSDLSKLTVPQLKALCKERRITGYSKLGKAALLQRLAEVVVPAKTTLPPKATPNVAVPHPNEAPNFANIERRQGNVAKVVRQPVQPSTEPTETSTTKAPLLARETPTKRPVHIDTFVPSKRIRTSLKSPSSVPTSTLPGKLPVDSSASVFKVPKVPVRPQKSLQASASKQPPVIKRPVVPRQITGTGQFKPILPLTPKPAEPRSDQATSITGADPLLDYDFHATALPVLSHITFPPKASERKWVYRWAIVLSALSPADRQTCMLVSRTFRYAVYLSAAHILSRSYAGRRLDTLFEQHPRNMTNFWPYLRLRMAEVSQRRYAFRQSFLGQYVDSLGYDPLSAHLWTSPDDEKQVDIALRFVLTRMWFAVSVGAYGHDASAWSKSIIRDVQEVVKGEIWQVTARHDGTGEMSSFYVLEATCEVIGQTSSSQLEGKSALGYCLRADWTAWISQRSRALPDAGCCSLLECVKWSNTEDYHRGISKAWLRRVQGQDADSVAKRSIAEKYILASVVANGISGQWMTTSAMAQEFAGLPGPRDAPSSRIAGRSMNTVNMYLAVHHHIESVHFTTSKGKALHAAVAVVQTPGREYYVLRDNGMQVGCEEEGIPEVWQQILGCNMLGQACSFK